MTLADTWPRPIWPPTAWPSLMLVPLVNADGMWAQRSGGAGRITSLNAEQVRVQLRLGHEGRPVGEIIYIERTPSGEYVALAQTILRDGGDDLDMRDRASLAARSFRREGGRDHFRLVLDHVALVERSGAGTRSVRLTTQKVRPPGRPNGWNDDDWDVLRTGWAWHERHRHDEYLRVVELPAKRSITAPLRRVERGGPRAPGDYNRELAKFYDDLLATRPAR